MKCRVCNEDKLSKEFPRENVTEQCDHPPIHCYRCVIKVLNNKSSGVCPYTDCHKPVSDVKSIIERCELELEQLYPSIKPSHDVEQMQQFEVSEQKINVVMLTGDSATFDYSPAMSVEMLKKQIEKKFKVAMSKQQLMYNECVLEDYRDGKMMCLKDYNIQAFHTVHLMVLMYEIPSHFNHCIFDLYWGYPPRGCDYLDASCLAYSGKSFIGVVDYCNNTSSTNSIRHSGDVMDGLRRIGHHTIEVHLKNIPSNITHLYFTLSAWNSPTISHFPNPSLKFFEASDKTKDLCKTTFSHARNSQAVIMCSVVRTGSQWKIFESGKLSAGNAKNYNPLVHTIQGL